MGIKIAKLCAAAAIGLAALTGAAQATIISETFTFSANGFTPAGGPLSALTGSFTLTFDPTLSYAFTTAGIVENSLNLPVSSVGFQYNPNANNGNLIIGGALNGATDLPNTNDFAVLLFQTKTNAPTMGGAQYSTSTSVVYSSLFQGTASVAPARVSEPLTLSLFGAGLAGGVALRRRRRKT